MNRNSLLLVLQLLLALALPPRLLATEAPPAPETQVREVVTRAMQAMYINGDEAAIDAALHDSYVSLLPGAKDITPYTKNQILAGLRQDKEAGKFPSFPGASYRIDTIDVVGDSALARVRFFQDGVHTCSDFVLLYRFADGWKWVTLTTYHHAPLRHS